MPRNFMRRWVPNGKLIRKSGLLLPLVFTLVFSVAPLSRAQDASGEDAPGSPARIARISYVQGEVQLDSGHGYESVTMNVPVTEHNWLHTRSDGWAEVQMEDGSMVRLAPDTIIGFTQFGRSSSGGTVTTIDLDQGEAEFKILKHIGGDFQVTVNNKTITLGHTGFFRVTSTNDDPMEIAVWKGDLGVRDGESGEQVAVKKNETFVLDPNDLGRYALQPGTQGDELDEWSKQRDESMSTYAAANHYTQSPYQYGASDLNYYGQYTEDPEYGNVWQPYGVGADWDPFSNGYYANSGLGATWISAYPWGWMPYRYGRWVFIGGRGWCWSPGGWNRLNTGPRIANAPPGFHAPTPPLNVKIAGRAPGQVVRPGEIANNPGRTAGAPGRSFANGDRNGQSSEPLIANRGSRHVFTNEEVQTVAPRTDSARTRSAVVDPDRRKGFEQAGQNGAGVQHTSNLSRADREPPPAMNRSNNLPSVSRPVRQPAPPQRSSSETVHERDRVQEVAPLSQSPGVQKQAWSLSRESEPSYSQHQSPASEWHPSNSSSGSSSSSNEGPRSRNR